MSSVHSRWMTPVNPSTVHSEVMKSAASAPRYATPSHSIGGPRRSPSRSRGWRWSVPELSYPLISVQAVVQSWYVVHSTSVRPSRHSAIGVVQYQMPSA